MAIHPDTFHDIVVRIRPQLLAAAQRLLSDADEAEDAVQDVLLKLWQLRHEPIGHVEGLAMTMLRHHCIDQLRRRPERVSLDDVVPDALLGQDDPNPRLAQGERLMIIVRSLPAMQQTVLTMRHVEGMDYAAIAAVLGTNEAAVRQNLSRARRRICADMLQSGGSPSPINEPCPSHKPL